MKSKLESYLFYLATQASYAWHLEQMLVSTTPITPPCCYAPSKEQKMIFGEIFINFSWEIFLWPKPPWVFSFSLLLFFFLKFLEVIWIKMTLSSFYCEEIIYHGPSHTRWPVGPLLPLRNIKPNYIFGLGFAILENISFRLPNLPFVFFHISTSHVMNSPLCS